MGRVQICFCGLNVACALRDLAERGVRLYDVRRSGKNCRLTVSVSDKKAVVAYLAKKCYNITATKFVGFAAAVDFARRRACIVVFALLTVLALCVADGLCLQVRVDGADEQKVNAALNELGTGRFSRMSRIDTDKLENQLAVGLNAAYVVVNKCGSTLYVSVKPARQTVSPVDMHKRRDIVADVGGVVTDVVCLAGTPAVKAGDKVVAGDVLIRGVCGDESNPTDVYAVGRVTVQPSVSAKIDFCGTITEEKETDEVFATDYVLLFGREFGRECPFDKFKRVDEKQYLPFGVVVVHGKFVRLVDCTVVADISRVESELKRLAEEKARAAADFEVTEVYFDVATDGVTCRLYGLSVCE